ncbi:MAG TPA: tRNA threonylcarbamoyladenosine dehydratase [Verrucomicrobiae bacterium]|nr:tRNA threonylcarbamoyladenosine dehydratase [Verrucomicrobiae bacterium]
MNEDLRFGGVQRLFGAAGLARLQRAHVCVIGLGGVGSWSVEALARSGVGHLTLVDLDDICVSNVNRQLHAVEGEFGRPKVDAMARRVQAIHPACVVRLVHAFFTASTAKELLSARFDYALDAIDNPANKALLISLCRQSGIPIMVAGAAGGRQSAASLRITDLAFATHDGLLREVRSRLRKEHGFPRGEQAFGVDCVFSTEPAVFPASDDTVCDQPETPPRGEGTSLRLDCESGYGTASFVTGAFGLAAAGQIVRQLAGGPPRPT